MRLTLLMICLIGVTTVVIAKHNIKEEKTDDATLMYQSCLKGVEAGLQAQQPSQDLDSLMAFHEKAKKACHCMAYDPQIIDATKRLARLQKQGKTAPFAISDEYQKLLMKTKERCFSNPDKSN